MALNDRALLFLFTALGALLVSAQSAEDEQEADDSWSLVLALVIVIVGLSLLAICLVVVICEIRTSKADPPPRSKSPEVELIDIAVQTDPEETYRVHATVGPCSSSEESIKEEPQGFTKLLDEFYNLSSEGINGRNATVVKAKMVQAPRDVVVKVYKETDPCLREYNFYRAIADEEGSPLMHNNNKARTFIPELIDAGQITISDRVYPALVLECGHFSLRDFILPKKASPRYVVLSDKSTFFQICVSLKFVHDNGYAHGDLHIGSVMFFGSRWKLIDFSTWGNAEAEMLCHSTPHYTAPEIIQTIAEGHSTTPAAQSADIWALGMIGWEILTKQPLLPASEYTNEDIEEMSFGRSPFPWEGKPAQFWRDIKSPAAAKIVQHCIHRDPEERWNIDKILQHMKFWS